MNLQMWIESGTRGESAVQLSVPNATAPNVPLVLETLTTPAPPVALPIPPFTFFMVLEDIGFFVLDGFFAGMFIASFWAPFSRCDTSAGANWISECRCLRFETNSSPDPRPATNTIYG
jgi:hypothetical protein